MEDTVRNFEESDYFSETEKEILRNIQFTLEFIYASEGYWTELKEALTDKISCDKLIVYKHAAYRNGYFSNTEVEFTEKEVLNFTLSKDDEIEFESCLKKINSDYSIIVNTIIKDNITLDQIVSRKKAD